MAKKEKSFRLNSNIERIISDSFEVKNGELSKPQTSQLKEILEQRKRQRDQVLKFTKIITYISLAFLILLILIQTLVRIFKDPHFLIVDEFELQILSAGVFGQIIGVIYVITKSLWDDKTYMEKL